MKKSIIPLSIVLMLVLRMLAACAPAATPTAEPPAAEAPAAEEPAAEAPAAEEPAAEPAKEEVKELNIVYLTPSTESGYWGEYVRIGVENAILDIEEKYGVKVNYTYAGPVAEADTAEYLSTLESVIAQKPDGIVMGQLVPESVAPLVKKATEMGIRVNLVSIGVDLDGSEYGSLYYCDQPEQGELAAKAYVEALKAKGLPLDGVTGVHMSVVVPVLEEKINKFVSTLKELAPDMEILDTQYNENDVNNGIGLMETQLATYGDKMVGFFGGNNVTGDAIVKVIEGSGRADKLVGIAVDSDPVEIEGMQKGFLDALVVQTPYDQAYNATMGIAEFVIDGKESEDMMNMPASVVTPDNMNTDEMKALLDPTLLKREK